MRDVMDVMDGLTEHDVVFRLTVTRRVTGRVTPDRKHKWVRALKRFLTITGSHRLLYTVDVCEVSAVRPVVRRAYGKPPNEAVST